MDSSLKPKVSIPTQRHLDLQEELLKNALNLPLEYKIDLVNKLIWSLPRNEISNLNEKLNGVLQRDIIGSLPPELGFLILSKLNFEDLLNCSLVSRKWRNICEEQALWALLCANHIPPIRSSNPSWSDISTARSILLQSKNINSEKEEEEEEEYDNDRFYNSGGMGGGGGLDPLIMKSGLRRNVWERQGLNFVDSSLPKHIIQFNSLKIESELESINQNQIKKDISPIKSYLNIPSIKPKVNFKHLFIINQIIKNRLLFNNNNCNDDENKNLIKPKTIDTFSSIKNGGLPGHSEAIYSLTLINHEMKFNLNQNCKECYNKPSKNSFTNLENQNENQFDFNSTLNFNINNNNLLPKNIVKGKEWLLSGSRDKTLRLWYIDNQEPPKVIKIFKGGHSGSVLTHAIVKINLFSEKDEKKSISSNNNKGINNLTSFEENLKIKQVKLIAISGGSDGKICLWNIEGSSFPEKVIKAHEDSVLCVRADERYVVSCSKDKTIKLFDIQTLEEKLVIGPSNGIEDDDQFHRGAVNAVGLSEDYIISASGDKTLRVWSIYDGQLLLTIEAHSRGIASIDFSTALTSCVPILNENEKWKGSIVTGASDASIKTFQLIEKKIKISNHLEENMNLNQDQNHSISTSSLNSFSMDQNSGNVKITYQAITNKGTIISMKEDYEMFSPCICPPGLHRPPLEFINLNNNNSRCKRCGNKGHTELIRTVNLNEKIIISGSYDSKVKVWDRLTGKLLINLSNSHTGRIFSVISDKFKIISSGLDCRINIWNFAYNLDTSFIEQDPLH
ncbi:uncharacterized protein I206_101152 [Kwoniella pini CBS 10737]|uniref:F-box domain-containing protein n=1 Tax=Kwoniella pini CBS 10737 TaxID=1296096 RepID=A0A1B9IBP1_9TREE|nr:uncharacterized protein I206_00174 [Kwoniella pini CBS 10737]OCF52874.1 hypothetical protein I206_00174 [Kwoniella pini CBS 10737]